MQHTIDPTRRECDQEHRIFLCTRNAHHDCGGLSRVSVHAYHAFLSCRMVFDAQQSFHNHRRSKCTIVCVRILFENIAFPMGTACSQTDRHTFIVSVAPNLPDQPKPVDPPHHALNAAPAYGGGGGNSYGYVPAVSAEDEASDESCVPWGPAAYKTAEPSCHTKGSLREDDRLWVEVTGLCVHFINQSFEERQRL